MSHARLEAVGGYLEPCSAILGHLEAVVRPLGGLSEAILSRAWLSWAILNAILGYLGLSWRSLGESWRPLGAILRPIVQKEGGFQLSSPPRRLNNGVLGALLGRSWAPLGRSLGRIGPLGPLLGLAWAILRLPKPIGSEKARRPKTLFFHLFLHGFGILEGAVEGSKGTLGSVLGLSWGLLEVCRRLSWPILRYLGPSWRPSCDLERLLS